jgi:hypothetical protein
MIDDIRGYINLVESAIHTKEAFGGVVYNRQARSPYSGDKQPMTVSHVPTDSKTIDRLRIAKLKKYPTADAYAADQIPEWPIYASDPPATKNRLSIQFHTLQNEWNKWKQDGLL